MKMSTKGRYGLRAMMDLATNQKDEVPVFLADVAKRTGYIGEVPRAYICRPTRCRACPYGTGKKRRFPVD